MGGIRWSWILVFAALVAAVPAVSGWAQEQSTQKQEDATAAVPSEADPEAGGATPEDTEEAERQRQRRRMRMVTAAQATIGGSEISLVTGRQPTESPDYETVDTLKPGEVLLLTQSQAIKLKTAANLNVGDALLKTENVAENYPGVYGIWLKRVEDGWHFVFNEKPDVWGTMYDPERDVAEVAVKHTTLDEANDRMEFELKEAGGGGLMRITWGKHQWSLPFKVVE